MIIMSLFHCDISFCQNNKSDSLKSELKKATNDTSRCIILNLLIESENNEDIWPAYNQQMLELSEKNLERSNLSLDQRKFFKKTLGAALNNSGYLSQVKGNNLNALNFYNRSLKIQEEFKTQNGDYANKKEIAYALINIASVYNMQGDIKKSLECYNRALKILEELKDLIAISVALNNLSQIYEDQGDIEMAKEYCFRSLKLNESTKNKTGIGQSHNNIGKIYLKQNKYQLALEHFNLSLQTFEGLKDIRNSAIVYNNIGTAIQKQGNNKTALEFYEKALKANQELDSKSGMITSFMLIGDVYRREKQFNKALDYINKSLLISHELGYLERTMNSEKILTSIYKSLGDHKKALESYESYIRIRDSINNESNRKASIKSQLKYEYEKQAAADSVAHAKESEIKNVEIAKQNAEIKAKKNQQYALFGGLGLVMLFAGFMYNRFKVTQKQKQTIEEQKQIVEEQKLIVDEKQKEILDSIHYAERIQKAHLPAEIFIDKSFKRLRS